MFEGFYKVKQEGGCYVTATMFNPVTGEEKTICVRDYDYADGSRDNDVIYDMEIDEAARIAWLHHHGEILTGDTVKVMRGRKVKVGTVAKVVDIQPYKNYYGQVVTVYAHLDTGERTSIDNLELVKEV